MRSVHLTSGLVLCKVISSATYIQCLSASALTFSEGSRAKSNKQFERLLLPLFITLVCLLLSPRYMWAFQRVAAFCKGKVIKPLPLF